MSGERRSRRFTIIADGDVVVDDETDYNEAIRTAKRRERVGADHVVVREQLTLGGGNVMEFTVYRTGENPQVRGGK